MNRTHTDTIIRLASQYHLCIESPLPPRSSLWDVTASPLNRLQGFTIAGTGATLDDALHDLERNLLGTTPEA